MPQTVEQEYDNHAAYYDEHFSDPYFMAEELIIAGKIKRLGQENVLDLGCGTGCILNHLKFIYYSGVDISSGMIERATLKHPNYKNRFTKAEVIDYLISRPGQRNYLSLFLSPSYFDPKFINHLWIDEYALFMFGSKRYLNKASYVNMSTVNLNAYCRDSLKTLFRRYRGAESKFDIKIEGFGYHSEMIRKMKLGLRLSMLAIRIDNWLFRYFATPYYYIVIIKRTLL